MGYPTDKELAIALLHLIGSKGRPVHCRETYEPLAKYYRLTYEERTVGIPSRPRYSKWHQRVQFGKEDLKQRGLVQGSATWGITTLGRQELARLRLSGKPFPSSVPYGVLLERFGGGKPPRGSNEREAGRGLPPRRRPGADLPAGGGSESYKLKQLLLKRLVCARSSGKAESAVNTLTPDEQKTLARIDAAESGMERTPDEVAARLGSSPQRVHEIECEAALKMVRVLLHP